MTPILYMLGVLGAAGLGLHLNRQRLDTLRPDDLLEWLKDARRAGIREVGVGKLRFVIDPPESAGTKIRLSDTPIGRIPTEEVVMTDQERRDKEWAELSRSAPG